MDSRNKYFKLTIMILILKINDWSSVSTKSLRFVPSNMYYPLSCSSLFNLQVHLQIPVILLILNPLNPSSLTSIAYTVDLPRTEPKWCFKMISQFFLTIFPNIS